MFLTFCANDTVAVPVRRMEKQADRFSYGDADRGVAFGESGKPPIEEPYSKTKP